MHREPLTAATTIPYWTQSNNVLTRNDKVPLIYTFIARLREEERENSGASSLIISELQREIWQRDDEMKMMMILNSNLLLMIVCLDDKAWDTMTPCYYLLNNGNGDAGGRKNSSYLASSHYKSHYVTWPKCTWFFTSLLGCCGKFNASQDKLDQILHKQLVICTF